MLSLNTNVASLFGANKFNSVSSELDKVSRQISTGKRIVSAGDDPAGIGIISTLKAQDQSYDAVAKNLSAGQSLLKVASTSLDSQQILLQQMKSLATQASSALLTTDQRTALSSQFVELQSQLNETVNRATIFGQNLTGVTAANVAIQSGIDTGNTFTLTAAKSDAATLAVDAATIDLSDTTKSSAAMAAIDTAIGKVASAQSTIGTQETGLEKLSEIANNTQLNIKSALSRIEDADIPALSAQLAQLQTKQQLQLQMLGISNQLPQYLLQLLR
jgi:flagellin